MQNLFARETRRRCALDLKGFPPAIAIYMKGKKVKTCPEQVLRQQQMWKEAVAKAGKVYIAGARIVEEDTHIWAPLRASRADIFYFGLSGDRDSFDQWKGEAKMHGKKNLYFQRAEFADAIPDIVTGLCSTY
jgi:hypothetical protein